MAAQFVFSARSYNLVQQNPLVTRSTAPVYFATDLIWLSSDARVFKSRLIFHLLCPAPAGPRPNSFAFTSWDTQSLRRFNGQACQISYLSHRLFLKELHILLLLFFPFYFSSLKFHGSRTHTYTRNHNGDLRHTAMFMFSKFKV